MAPQVDIEPEEESSRTVAKHEYLNKDGELVDDEESAYGYRYTLTGNDESVEWSWDKASEDERRLYAIFGVKTLCTNESSQVRNFGGKAKPNKHDYDGQIKAVRDRVALISGGQWVDRTREGGLAVDRPKLATALVNMQIAAGKFGEDKRDEKFAEALRRFEEEAGYMAKVRRVPQVAEEYSKQMGRQAVTIDDL